MEMNAVLDSIHSSEEDALMNFLCSSDQCWTGMNDNEIEGIMKWIDGTTVDYTNFYVGQPDNKDGDEHFVKLRVDGKWNDQQWDLKYYALCKRPHDNNYEAPKADHRRIVYSQQEGNEELESGGDVSKSDMANRKGSLTETTTVSLGSDGY